MWVNEGWWPVGVLRRYRVAQVVVLAVLLVGCGRSAAAGASGEAASPFTTTPTDAIGSSLPAESSRANNTGYDDWDFTTFSVSAQHYDGVVLVSMNQPQQGYPAAGITGTLGIDPDTGCVVLLGQDALPGAKGADTVWPYGFTVRRTGSAAEILTDDGEVWGTIGQPFSSGGGVDGDVTNLPWASGMSPCSRSNVVLMANFR